MLLAAVAKDRLSGVCLNDIGPDIATEGLAVIMDYVGRTPPQKTHADMAEAMATRMVGFEGVSSERWQQEARTHFTEDAEGLAITYDPALGDVVRAGAGEPAADLWPWFDALEGLPLACIRGANSDLLSPETFAEMQARRPDMIAAEVPGRGHIPFLDEPEALVAIAAWRGRLPAV